MTGVCERSPDPIQRLILELARLPGVGQRSAARLAFYIIRNSQGERLSLAKDLAQALLEVTERVGFCSVCQNLSASPVCSICNDARRDSAVVCVVEGVGDLRAIESSGAFRGVYHVLHGSLAPLDGIGPEQLKIRELLARIRHGVIREVILATNSDVDGDATALYLGKLLQPLGAHVTRLASGIPLGGELEYVDHATLGRALLERRQWA